MQRVCLILVLHLALPSASHAGIFDGLFNFPSKTASETAVETEIDQRTLTTVPDQAICIQAIREAERVHGIPHDLLMALGLQEAGMSFQGSRTIWPWSVNVEGRGHRFDTRAEAEAFVQGQLAQGKRSIDVGCLQINLRWHPDAFPTPGAGFDPALNADYAARFLTNLKSQTGDWWQAAGHYHSATPERKAIYLAGLSRHVAALENGSVKLDALAGQVRTTTVSANSPKTKNKTAGISVAEVAPRRMRPLKTHTRHVQRRDPSFVRVLEPLPTSTSNRDPSPAPSHAEQQVSAGWSATLSDDLGGAASLFGGAARPLFSPSPPAN
ncbi:MAG: hypothetical protein ACEPO2_11205 [Pelagibaca sp.]